MEILTRERGSRLVKEILETVHGEELYASSLQIAEIADWCLRNGRPLVDRVSTVKEFIVLVPLDEEVMIEAASIKNVKRKAGQPDFGLIDGIILATARSIEQKVLTFDPHFEGEKDCIVLVSSRG